MPLYEYRCKSCGQAFDKLVSRASADSVTCPHCESASVERLLSLFGLGKGGGAVGSSAVYSSGSS